MVINFSDLLETLDLRSLRFLQSCSDEFPAVRLCQLGGWEKAGQRLVFLSPLRFRDELSGLYAGIQYNTRPTKKEGAGFPG